MTRPQTQKPLLNTTEPQKSSGQTTAETLHEHTVEQSLTIVNSCDCSDHAVPIGVNGNSFNYSKEGV